MSKAKKAKPGMQALNAAVTQKMARDTFSNPMARTGYGTPNLMEASQYVVTRFTRDYQTLNALYRNSWIAQRIVDIVPKDMTKNWIKFTSEITPDQIDIIQKADKRTRVRSSILRGLKWGRLYGGALGLMMIDGQSDLAAPLDIELVMPGDFKGVQIVDRWSGVYPLLGLVEDVSSPEFGLPEMYEFRDITTSETFEVHHTRVLRFTGKELPAWESQVETYWGSSVLEACYEEIRKRDNTSANISGLIFLANLRILKMDDLGEMLAGTPSDVQNDLFNTIQAQSWLQSNFGMYVMSKEDEFQSVQMNFGGLNEIYESFMMDVAGAAQIPVTKLFGRSPAGMNATGEGDADNYYDAVKNDQEELLRPILEKLLPVHFMSALGEVPEDLDFMFNPIQPPSQEDLGNMVKYKTEAIFGYHDRGIISDKSALTEASYMSDETGLFTSITDREISAADDKARGPEMGLEQEEDPDKEDKLD